MEWSCIMTNFVATWPYSTCKATIRDLVHISQRPPVTLPNFVLCSSFNCASVVPVAGRTMLGRVRQGSEILVSDSLLGRGWAVNNVTWRPCRGTASCDASKVAQGMIIIGPNQHEPSAERFSRCFLLAGRSSLSKQGRSCDAWLP